MMDWGSSGGGGEVAGGYSITAHSQSPEVVVAVPVPSSMGRYTRRGEVWAWDWWTGPLRRTGPSITRRRSPPPAHTHNPTHAHADRQHTCLSSDALQLQ